MGWKILAYLYEFRGQGDALRMALELSRRNADPPEISQGDGVLTRARSREELDDYQDFSKELEAAERAIGATNRRDYPLPKWRTCVWHLKKNIHNGEKWKFDTVCNMEALLRILITIWSNRRLC